MTLSLIAAMTPDRVIGKDNQLPWQMPADLQYFKKQTLNKPIVMGRKTFQSIGRPLSNRRNIVITRNNHFKADGVEIFHSIESALSAIDNKTEIMIIGGETLFKEMLPLAQFLYITIIHANISGDTYFPEWNQNDWKEIARDEHKADERNPYDYDFLILENKELYICTHSMQ